MMTTPSFLFVHTYYPEFLDALYADHGQLAVLPFEAQRRRIFETRFGVSDAYSDGLRRLGCDAQEVIANADALQASWACAHGVTLSGNIHDQRRQIVAAQIDHYRPDVLYVFEWNPLGDAFVTEMKSKVRLTIGQIASPLPDNRTFAGYDLVISSYPPIVDYFAKQDGRGALLRLAFDARVLDQLPQPQPEYAVTFVGGFAPSHPDRIAWLASLARTCPVEVFGYGAENIPTGSPLRARHRGEVWGLPMYEVLARSRVTLNRHAHINVRGATLHRFANNMRLYEASGVGACLLTERRDNLGDILEPDRECVTYTSDAECADRIRNILENDQLYQEVGRAAQEKTLSKHTYALRMAELLEIVRARI